MGYDTYITGSVEIIPAPSDAPPAHLNTDADTNGYFVFHLQPGDETVELVDGKPTVVGTKQSSLTVEPAFAGSSRAYDFDERVADLVEWVKTTGSQMNGAFEGDGEEADDFWQIRIDDNKMLHEDGRITYPSERYAEVASDLKVLLQRWREEGNALIAPYLGDQDESTGSEQEEAEAVEAQMSQMIDQLTKVLDKHEVFG